VIVIATSHDTAPAGSKYLAFDRKRCAVSPSIAGFALSLAVAPAPSLVGLRVDFVTDCESPHSRSDFEHDSSDVVAQDEREAKRQKLLELARLDLGIHRVHARGMDLDQNIILPHDRVRHVACPQPLALSITVDHEGLHGRTLAVA
jgi:hypothetical protein